jgi:hypothetical protein
MEAMTEEDFLEKPKPEKKPRSHAKTDDSGQLDMFS